MKYTDETWQQALSWVMREHESNLGAADLESLRQWLCQSAENRNAYQQASALWQMTGLIPTPDELNDPS